MAGCPTDQKPGGFLVLAPNVAFLVRGDEVGLEFDEVQKIVFSRCPSVRERRTPLKCDSLGGCGGHCTTRTCCEC